MRVFFILVILVNLIFSLRLQAEPINTTYVTKFRCSPANKMVQSLNKEYILSAPTIPSRPLPSVIMIVKYFRIVSGPQKGKVGTAEELAKLPGVDNKTLIEQVARFGQINSPVLTGTQRVFRSFYDSNLCKAEEAQTCLWNDMLNVYQDSSISTDGTHAAFIANGDGYTSDILVMDLRTKQKTILFTSAYQRPYETSGKSVGQVNFINDVKGNPRYLAFRDGGYGLTKISITFFDLVTREQVTVPREVIEDLIGVKPDPIYYQYVDAKTFFSINIEKLLNDVRSGILSTRPVVVTYKMGDKIVPSCAAYEVLN